MTSSSYVPIAFSRSCLRLTVVAVLVAVLQYTIFTAFLEAYSPPVIAPIAATPTPTDRVARMHPLPAWSNVVPSAWEAEEYRENHPFICPPHLDDPDYLLYCNFAVENLSFERGVFHFHLNDTSFRKYFAHNDTEHTIQFSSSLLDGKNESYTVVLDEEPLRDSLCNVVFETPAFVFSPVDFDDDHHFIYHNLLPLYSTMLDEDMVGNDTLLISTTPIGAHENVLQLFSNQDPITLSSLYAFKKVCFKKIYFSSNKAKVFYQRKRDPATFATLVDSFKTFVVRQIGLDKILPQESTVTVLQSPHFTNSLELVSTLPRDKLRFNALDLSSSSFVDKLKAVRGSRILIGFEGIEWGVFLEDGGSVLHMMHYGVAGTHWRDEIGSLVRANNIMYWEWEAPRNDSSLKTILKEGEEPDVEKMFEDAEYRKMWLEQDTTVPHETFLQLAEERYKAALAWNGYCSSCASTPPSRGGVWCAELDDPLGMRVMLPYCVKEGDNRMKSTAAPSPM